MTVSNICIRNNSVNLLKSTGDDTLSRKDKYGLLVKVISSARHTGSFMQAERKKEKGLGLIIDNEMKNLLWDTVSSRTELFQLN